MTIYSYCVGHDHIWLYYKLNLSFQSSLTDDLAERTENERVHLTAAQEENEKLRKVLQSEINEYKVEYKVASENTSNYSAMQCIIGTVKAVCHYNSGT